MTTQLIPTRAPRERGWHNLPLVKQLRQSVGLQRGMLVTGLVLVVLFAVVALFAPLIAPYSYSALSGPDGDFGSLTAPSAAHPFGTTIAGYDVLSRVVWGARTAFLVILIAVVSSIFVGTMLGLVSGYLGGVLDRVLVMIADAIYAFPSLLLAIVLSIVISGGQSSLWGGIWAASLSITVVFIPQYFRVVRSEVVRVKAEAFVESARVIGSSRARVMFKHVLRNSTRSLPLVFTLNASEAILTLAGLGFLGFGIEPNSAAEWGYDLNKAIADVTNGVWWTSLWPGLAIVLVVMGLTLTGESLNDLADPRLRSRRKAKAGSGVVANTAMTETVATDSLTGDGSTPSEGGAR
ncbi:ABC transporter permease [Leucobacter albus]|uniref:ABC transporter permease n=1 Tax=Leucobacter albus TaxID=272210 RepID=A0ABW3TS29_9MICO